MLKQIKNLIALRKLNKLKKYINERIKEYENSVFEERVKLNYYSYKMLLKQIREIIGDEEK